MTFDEILPIIKPYTMMSRDRLRSLYDLATAAPGGCFVECGVCRGGSSALLAHIAKSSKRILWCCDSFAGIPAPTVEDGDPDTMHVKEGHFKEATIKSLAEVCHLVDVNDVVFPIKGLFEETLPRNPVGPIALLHMDGDWYKSTMDILVNLYDKVVPGGFIQVDDYCDWIGCRHALHEFEIARGLAFALNDADGARWFRKPK